MLLLTEKMIWEATAFLLDVLKPNLPEHAFLETKVIIFFLWIWMVAFGAVHYSLVRSFCLYVQVLEINLVTYLKVADAIFANGVLSHYDHPRIAQLCEKAGLYLPALHHVSAFELAQLISPLRLSVSLILPTVLQCYSELPDIKRNCKYPCHWSSHGFVAFSYVQICSLVVLPTNKFLVQVVS